MCVENGSFFGSERRDKLIESRAPNFLRHQRKVAFGYDLVVALQLIGRVELHVPREDGREQRGSEFVESSHSVFRHHIGRPSHHRHIAGRSEGLSQRLILHGSHGVGWQVARHIELLPLHLQEANKLRDVGLRDDVAHRRILSLRPVAFPLNGHERVDRANILSPSRQQRGVDLIDRAGTGRGIVHKHPARRTYRHLRVANLLWQPDTGKAGVFIFGIDEGVVLVRWALAKGRFFGLDNHVVDQPYVSKDVLVKLVVAYLYPNRLKGMCRDEQEPTIYFVPTCLPVGQI